MKSINRIYIPPIPAKEKEIIEVIKKNLLVTGPHLELFGEQLKKRYRKKHCVLTANAFSALLLGMLSMKDKKAKVLVPAVSTCFSFVNAILAAGFQPVFCDVDILTSNLDIKAAKKSISKNKIDLVISPNHFGINSPVDVFKELGLPVIEDAAQSVLTNLDEKTNADMLVFSFYPTKILNGIDGGALLTDDEVIYNYAMNHVYYGKQYQFEGQARFNFRMPNLHAFMALQSLLTIDQTKERFDELFVSYQKEAINSGFNFLGMGKKFTPFRFLIKLKSKTQRNKIANYCEKKRIYCGKELIMISDQSTNNHNAKLLTDTTLSLPFHEKMTNSQIKYLFSTLINGYNFTQS